VLDEVAKICTQVKVEVLSRPKIYLVEVEVAHNETTQVKV